MIVSGCSLPPRPICIFDGKQCSPDSMFTERWFDYYEWAMTYQACKCYDLAIDGLNKSIETMPEEKRWKRTIGMHFIEYFPHREKGIIYYLMNELEKAEQELTLSISQEESSKAKYFMNQVRKAKIEQTTKERSTPTIRFLYPNNIKLTNANQPDRYELKTNEENIIIQGVVSGNQYISDLCIDKTPIFIELSQVSIQFDQSLHLNEGYHDIPITAKTLVQGEKTVWINIHVDRSGPMIIIDEWRQDHSVIGRLIDRSGIVSLKANDNDIQIQSNNTVEFLIPLSKSNQTLKLVATDLLGNQTHSIIDQNLFQANYSQIWFANKQIEYMADTDQSIYKHAPLKIMLSQLKQTETVFRETIPIDGTVLSLNNLSRFDIDMQHPNSQTWESVHHNNFKKGQFVTFNQSVQLSPGKNIIRIKATDRNKQTLEHIILIHRKTLEIMNVKYRYGLKLDTFQSFNTSSSILNMFSMRFLENIVTTNRFQILMNKVNYSLPSDAGLTGKANLRLSCSGKIDQSDAGIEVSVRVDDIETGEVLYVDIFDRFSENIEHQINIKIQQLIQKLLGLFPLEKAQAIQMPSNKYRANFKSNIPLDWDLYSYVENHQDILRGSDSLNIKQVNISEKQINNSVLFDFKQPIQTGQTRWVIPK